MSEVNLSSVCIDDNRFFALIDSALSEQGISAPIIRYCQENEANFLNCLIWLDSREGHCPLAENALRCAVLELSKRVSFIHAFHGCRVTPDSEYCTEGIQPPSREWVERQIVKWAGELPTAGSEADRLLQDYLSQHTGKVWAAKSLLFHQNRGGYCHAIKSETLHNVLRSQSPVALARYLETGEPSIIEFRIPTTQLTPKVWENFVSDLLRIWLKNHCQYPGRGDPREGGIVLDRVVSPSWLIQRHCCDENGKLTGIRYPLPTLCGKD
jgi:hypothetical protein